MFVAIAWADKGLHYEIMELSVQEWIPLLGPETIGIGDTISPNAELIMIIVNFFDIRMQLRACNLGCGSSYFVCSVVLFLAWEKYMCSKARAYLRVPTTPLVGC